MQTTEGIVLWAETWKNRDSRFLKQVHIPAGSILVFDRGYYDFKAFNSFSSDNITWVTRLRQNFAFDLVADLPAGTDKSILSDQGVLLGYKRKTRVEARLITFQDPVSAERHSFLSNNFRMPAASIATLYKKRWQIELFFKRMKQGYPLKYFLGDSENAIKIQIWCALIADLLLKLIKKGAAAKWSFSNLAAMIRLHLMTYINLYRFLKSPEKSLLALVSTQQSPVYNRQLFAT